MLKESMYIRLAYTPSMSYMLVEQYAESTAKVILNIPMGARTMRYLVISITLAATLLNVLL